MLILSFYPLTPELGKKFESQILAISFILPKGKMHESFTRISAKSTMFEIYQTS